MIVRWRLILCCAFACRSCDILSGLRLRYLDPAGVRRDGHLLPRDYPDQLELVRQSEQQAAAGFPDYLQDARTFHQRLRDSELLTRTRHAFEIYIIRMAAITEELEGRLEAERKNRALDSIPEVIRYIVSDHMAKS